MEGLEDIDDSSLSLWQEHEGIKNCFLFQHEQESNNDNLEDEQEEEEEEEEGEESLISELPTKSKFKYILKYKSFREWRKKRYKTNIVTEDVMLTYFKELSEKNLPSTLYSVYSILKTMLLQEEQIDIAPFMKLKNFLSMKSKGFKSKKAEHLTAQNVSDFIKNAPNKKYLAHKVLLIFGVAGACKTFELKRIRITDVTEHGQLFRVNIPLTASKISRSFIINEEFYPIVKQYISQRPPAEEFSIPVHQDFFLHYKDGVCTTQQMGRNTIATIPKQVAEYLKLPNPGIYTGHCFRQTSYNIRSSKNFDTLDLLTDKTLLDSFQFSTNEDSSLSQSHFNIQASSGSENDESVTRSFKNKKTKKNLGSTQNHNNHFAQDVEDSCTMPEMVASEPEYDNDEAYEPVAKKSKKKCTDKYAEYVNWQKSTGIKETNETILLAYFTILSNKLEPNELLATYSTIKTMLWKKEKINIRHYDELNMFLKSNCKSSSKEEKIVRNFSSVTLGEDLLKPKIDMSVSEEERSDDDAESDSSEENFENHDPRKAEHLSAENVSDFIKNAPDKKYLAAKVILIFGVTGACRTLELKRIKFTDVKEHDQLFCVDIAATNTERKRSFIINEEYYPIVKKYINKRPKIEDFSNPVVDFFLQYEDGKCTTQQIGINTIGAVPKLVAEYLKLPNANFYTGHCFRQTFANIHANQFLNSQDVSSEDENSSDPLQIPTNKETSQFETCIIKNESVLDDEIEESVPECFDLSDNDSEEKSSSLKTKIDYNTKYKELMAWKKSIAIKETKENTLLAYFAILSHKLDSDKLWDTYCAIKKTLWKKDKIDIRFFSILNVFLKNYCEKNYLAQEQKVSIAGFTDDLQSEPEVATDEKLVTRNDEMSDSDDGNDKIDISKTSSSLNKNGYKKFVEWKDAVKKNVTNEKVLLDYFKMQSIKFTPSTLYKIFSSLKAELMEKENIDISKYTELKSFLRYKTNSYEPMKAEAFTVRNVSDFLKNAPDRMYLAAKVILIFGISGACKTTELRLITMKDVEEHGQIFCVNIPVSKTRAARTFIVNEKFYSIVKRYIDSRPEDNVFNDFFLNFHNGRCSRNPIGRNKIANTPKQIAEYLNLPFASNYTSYSFRETSVNIRAEFKVNIINDEKKRIRKRGFVKKYSEDSSQNSRPEGSPTEDPLRFESCFIKEELSNSGASESED